MSNQIKIHVFHCGEVCTSPYLPYGGDNCNILKASGLTVRKQDRIWLPVSAYLIEHPKGLILFDTGWHRNMSPDGIYDRKAQIKSLGSALLYEVNQGRIEKGAAVHEQLAKLGITPQMLDYVVLSHLDCDHANGLKQVADAKRILVSADELKFASKTKNAAVRYQKLWWQGVRLETFDWTGTAGPFRKSYDLLGNGSIQLINIPGHADGQAAMKITGETGKFVLLCADGAYSAKSWEQMVRPGICPDPQSQMQTLRWLKDQSRDANCVEILANHDPSVVPHKIVL